MKKAADDRFSLDSIMDAAVRNNPHSRDIIKAFRPVLIEKARLVSTLEPGETISLVIDEARFNEGVPLGNQSSLFFPDDPWKTVALALIPAVMKGFPALVKDLEKLQGILDSGAMDLGSADPEIMRRDASAHDMDVQALSFVAHMTGRTILEMKARQWGKLLEGFTWDRGYCPVCGSAPMIAKIREGQSARILHCSLCGHEWNFSRVICPSCGNNEQKTMTYFLVADKSQESTFVCEKCKQYLITADRVSDLLPFDAEVCALSLVHLDVMMQEKGYTPMAACEWNTFS